MDTTLLRTFLEVAASGSFVNSAAKLFVTQSAVSLRINRLEESLGRPLFTRARTGAELTPAGREFQKYARSILQVWEEARQHASLPDGVPSTLTIGAQDALWPRLGFKWIDRLRARLPDLQVRAESTQPRKLKRMLQEGNIQVGIMYAPLRGAGLTSQRVMEEELVLVATWAVTDLTVIAADYVLIDWGPEFVVAHSEVLPELAKPALTFALGAMTVDYVVNRRAAAYLPIRYVKKHLDQGELHLVPDAPRFPYPVWAIWRNDLDPVVAQAAKATLADIAQASEEERDTVIDSLNGMSKGTPFQMPVEIIDHAESEP